MPVYLHYYFPHTFVCLFVFSMIQPVIKPYVRLTLTEVKGSSHSHMLVCSVYSFYPRDITVTWLQDGEVVTDDVTTTGTLSNGNWLYQIHTHLDFTPKFGQKFTCKVEHASFKKPRLYEWSKTFLI